MGICKNCKHWKADWAEKSFMGLTESECGRIPMREDVNERNKGCTGPTLIEGHEGLKAYVYDGYGYIAGLVTREDFGCVMFEEVER